MPPLKAKAACCGPTMVLFTWVQWRYSAGYVTAVFSAAARNRKADNSAMRIAVVLMQLSESKISILVGRLHGRNVTLRGRSCKKRHYDRKEEVEGRFRKAAGPRGRHLLPRRCCSERIDRSPGCERRPTLRK